MIVKGLNPIFIYLFQNLNCLNFLSLCSFYCQQQNEKLQQQQQHHQSQRPALQHGLLCFECKALVHHQKKFLQNLQLQVFGNTLKLIVVSCNFSLHNLQLQVFGTTLKLTVVSCNFSLFYVKRESMICNSPSSPFPTIYVFSARKKTNIRKDFTSHFVTRSMAKEQRKMKFIFSNLSNSE